MQQNYRNNLRFEANSECRKQWIETIKRKMDREADENTCELSPGTLHGWQVPPLLACYPLILGNIDLGKGVTGPNQGNWGKGVTDHSLVTGD